MPVQYSEVARREIATLILSDDHPNVLRCFALEEDQNFVYLGLERCSHSLADLMLAQPHLFHTAHGPTDFAIQVSPAVLAAIMRPHGLTCQSKHQAVVPCIAHLSMWPGS